MSDANDTKHKGNQPLRDTYPTQKMSEESNRHPVELAQRPARPDAAMFMEAQPMQSIKGNRAVVPKGAHAVRPLPEDTPIRLTIQLNWRNEKELEKLIEDQANPKSPNYRHFLSTEEFKNRFSPTKKDVQDIVNWLRSEGMTVSSISGNRVLIEVTTTAKKAQLTFATQMWEYDYKGKKFYANVDDAAVPQKVAPKINSIGGLDDFPAVKEMAPKNQIKNVIKPLSPQDIATTYNFPNTTNPNSDKQLTGRNTTISIIGFGSYDRKGTDKFWKHFGINHTGTVTEVRTSVPVNYYGLKPSPACRQENTMDVQQIGAQAPAANIKLHLATRNTTDDFRKVINSAVSENKSSIVSISYGGAESAFGPVPVQAINKLLMEGAAQGQAIFVASGDDGAYADKRDPKQYQVNFPASSPYVTAVGGTELNSQQEHGWTNSGGGGSRVFFKPSFQSNVFKDYAGRMVPDVSFLAGNPGIYVYMDNQWLTSGGTSMGAPNLAGLWALGQEYTTQRLGNPNPHLYSMASNWEYKRVFKDITQGTNHGNSNKVGFSAGPRYDAVTGLGSPNGDGLVSAMFDRVGKSLQYVWNPATKKYEGVYIGPARRFAIHTASK